MDNINRIIYVLELNLAMKYKIEKQKKCVRMVSESGEKQKKRKSISTK